LQKTRSEDELDQQIIRTVKEARPENVEQLVKLIQAETLLPQQEILNRVVQLNEKGKINFQPQSQKPACQTFRVYLLSNRAYWYWTTITLTLLTMIVVFVTPEDAFPLVYLRYALGSIFVLWFPGYALIKALFPNDLPFGRATSRSQEMSEKDLDTIERIAVSLGTSLSLVLIIGLLLNYTAWGITLTPIVLSLVPLTMMLSTTALVREYTSRTGN
jgi:hypothetical protein